MLATPDEKEEVQHSSYQPITPVDAFTNAFGQIQDSIKKNPCDTAQHQYDLRSKLKVM